MLICKFAYMVMAHVHAHGGIYIDQSLTPCVEDAVLTHICRKIMKDIETNKKYIYSMR